MAEAVGILEVFGLATAFVAATQTACQYRFWYASNSAEASRTLPPLWKQEWQKQTGELV